MDISNKNICIDNLGTKRYKNSKGYYHRKDGPAIECSNGDKFWYKEGECHRVDGPAIEYFDRNKYWSILHKILEEKDFNSWLKRIKIFI